MTAWVPSSGPTRGRKKTELNDCLALCDFFFAVLWFFSSGEFQKELDIGRLAVPVPCQPQPVDRVLVLFDSATGDVPDYCSFGLGGALLALRK